MCSTRFSAPARHGRATPLARPLSFCVLGIALLAGCGEGESATWVGVQDCAVGIPPQELGASLTSVQLPLREALVTPLGNGFSIRNFTLGPVGAASALFSCDAPQVTARFAAEPVSADGTFAAAGGGGPVRAIEIVPFECRGADGRSYTLEGEGQSDQDALFFNQTFSAWLGAERATLVCSTRFQRQLGAAATDAGVMAPPTPFGPAPAEPLGE